MTGITCMILGKWRRMAKINGQWYYFWPFTENGHIQGTMAYGGWKIIGADYYFFREDGSLYTGWLEQNGSWYYLNTLDNSLQGAMFTGWLIREGKLISWMLTELWLPAGIRLTGIGIISGRIQVKWQKTSISMDSMLMRTESGTGKDM